MDKARNNDREMPLKDFYVRPDIEVVNFDYADIIRTSGCNGDCDRLSCQNLDGEFRFM